MPRTSGGLWASAAKLLAALEADCEDVIAHARELSPEGRQAAIDALKAAKSMIDDGLLDELIVARFDANLKTGRQP